MTLIFINPISISLIIITLFLPFHLLWRFWFFIVIILIAPIPYMPRDPDPGPAYMLGMMVLMAYGLVLGGLFSLRGVIEAIRRLRNPSRRTEDTKFLYVADLGLFALAGSVFAGIIFIFFGWSFSTAPLGFFIHFYIVVLSAAIIFALLRFLLRNRSRVHWRRCTFFLTVSSALLVLSLAGAFYPLIVIGDAEAKALGDPHCILLGARHRPADSWQDLTFFSMDKREREHHAVLLIKRRDVVEPYYWSYRARQFMPDVINQNSQHQSSEACSPEKNFTRDLRIITLVEPKIREPMYKELFSFGDVHLRIPSVYKPVSNDSYLSIAAAPPDFAPIARNRGVSYPSVEYRSRSWLQSVAEKYVSGEITGRMGDLIEVGKDYYQVNDEGEIQTLISCYRARNGENWCQHHFYRDGGMYTFYHSRDVLGRWSEMEQRLFDLFASFEVD